MGPLASRQRELLAMELLVEAQTSMVVSIGLVAVNRSALASPLELPTKALLLLTAPVGPFLVRRPNQASIEHRRWAHQSRRRDRLSQAEGWKARWSRGEMHENAC